MNENIGITLFYMGKEGEEIKMAVAREGLGRFHYVSDLEPERLKTYLDMGELVIAVGHAGAKGWPEVLKEKRFLDFTEEALKETVHMAGISFESDSALVVRLVEGICIALSQQYIPLDVPDIQRQLCNAQEQRVQTYIVDGKQIGEVRETLQELLRQQGGEKSAKGILVSLWGDASLPDLYEVSSELPETFADAELLLSTYRSLGRQELIRVVCYVFY